MLVLCTSDLIQESDKFLLISSEAIATPMLLIQNEVEVSAFTLRRGRGGNIEVTADRVDLEGVSASGRPSALGSETLGVGSSAKAGDVTLKTRILNIRERVYGLDSTIERRKYSASRDCKRVK